MPYLISLETCQCQVVAAAGFRPAGTGSLFLENYLSEPVECMLGKKLGFSIVRESLLEVGNLAADGSHSSRLMIMAMTAFFYRHDFVWVAMTGTNRLVNILTRMQLEPVELIKADAEKLGDEKINWGSYYKNNPKVMAGNITRSHEKMLKTVNYKRFIRSLQLVNCFTEGQQCMAIQ